MQKQVSTKDVGIYTENLQWADLKFCRFWLTKHDTIEASTLRQFLTDLWHDDALMDWSMINKQKAWLATVDSHVSPLLIDLLEHIQDLAFDTGMFTYDEIYGTRDVVKQVRPSNLKLVVSNYFTPRERLDRPFPPAPELTILK